MVSLSRPERAERIHAQLDRIYPDPKPPLDHRDPFTLLVAVMLSAQCTDRQVNRISPALFDRAPDAAALAAMKEEEILKYVKTINHGPTKAARLKGMAAQLLRLHGGEVPEDSESLEELPGVGHKTAEVVRAQAFRIPSFPVDTHILRLGVRWGLSDGPGVPRVERDLKAIFPKESWNRLHIQFILFGRERCPARGHVVEDCPICSWAMGDRPASPLESPRGTPRGSQTG